MNSVINRFVGEHYFLSNFYPSTLYLDGLSYPTAEHAYQANKCLDVNTKEIIRNCSDPLEAKKLGRQVALCEDWESTKIPLMKRIIREKFNNPFLRELLIGTGSAKLIHDNKFNDKFWGICRGEGENWLGLILEEVREHLLLETSDF